jgi:hypothetical protein
MSEDNAGSLHRQTCSSNKAIIFGGKCRIRRKYRYSDTARPRSTGRNLPTQVCPAGWRFEQSITLRLDGSSPKQELIKGTLAAIATHGFYLTHAAIHAFPVASAHDRAKNRELTRKLQNRETSS